MRRRTLIVMASCVALLGVRPQPLDGQAGRPLVTLTVDATDTLRRMLHARESIVVRPGALTLLYPKWIPGEHGPTGPIVDMAGLKMSAGGKPIAWRRDLEEMFAIHCEVPVGADTLDVSFFSSR